MKRRYAVLKRADWRCEECGDFKELEVHHLNGVTDNRMENLRALCRPCHARANTEPPPRAA